MTTHKVLLESREEVAKDTFAFHFQKPAGFAFKPGQAVDLILANPLSAGAADLRHTFSLVSTPFEGLVTIATRMRDSAFKRVLKTLPIGAAANLEGPFGSLTLNSSQARPAAFIAGGIGITPFMSILRQAARDQLPQSLLLLYSNRRPEDAAFLPELQELERLSRNFRLLATMTSVQESNHAWSGMTGRIDHQLIRTIRRDSSAQIFYVTGSPSMVSSVRKMLNDVGVDNDDIRIEEFFGY